MMIEGKDNVLILTGSFGEGHVQAAHAIKQAINIRSPKTEATIVDFMEWVHPNLYPLSHYVYMKSLKTCPHIYGYMYEKTYDQSVFSKTINTLLSGGMKKALQMLKMVQPSVIVSTYPFASSVISKLKEYGLITIPLVTVITDYSYHSSWLHPYTDHYLVGSYNMRQKLIRLGISGSKISCTGIPIKPSFLKQRKKEDILKKYHFRPDLPTVLIMGGGDGMMGNGILETEKLNDIPFPVQFIIICGHNEKLRVRLNKQLISSKHIFHIKGYIDYVHDVMAVSDVMITKPGGVTTAEALAMELPMILYKPLPGQEEDNARFLIHSGVAVQAEDGREVIEQITCLLSNQRELEAMKVQTRQIQNKESAFRALKIIDRSKDIQYHEPPEMPTQFLKRKRYARMRKKSLLMNQGQ
ncbi:1,2-diacylglycerol 3-glucosyltransferase [Bacillus ginsengihumi]|uniref:1,2-diacylglycerol 3-glucosyltransferase n=2 Tax=Heyndrickxia ginsengihumi TaxID=363870 RepID=A0A0A6VIM5_9BACI|nr:1,2-diacylglycerol 3-glucosyltransferase [Heyndrickxia ginsengihumi]MBE6182990.1 1,2-diacylglycerol 3-glucosyltransferase [Bacillus sp. (in: firmicutes)]NEY19244.1 1,2-diacylglycerol 3-glucosyltransferase [Heyndrickxia ginsengihumi]